MHFHLAEQKDNTTTPFAFLATYTSGLGAGKKVKHLPLARALEEYSAATDRSSLLSLLAPVRAAAERSELLGRLVDTKAIFHPLSWTAAEARAFLLEIPACEESGVVVKVPDWWKDRRAPRPVVSVTVGSDRPASGVGRDALLGFSVELSLDGETLNKTEIRELLESNEGLAFMGAGHGAGRAKP